MRSQRDTTEQLSTHTHTHSLHLLNPLHATSLPTLARPLPYSALNPLWVPTLPSLLPQWALNSEEERKEVEEGEGIGDEFYFKLMTATSSPSGFPSKYPTLRDVFYTLRTLLSPPWCLPYRPPFSELMDCKHLF